MMCYSSHLKCIPPAPPRIGPSLFRSRMGEWIVSHITFIIIHYSPKHTIVVIIMIVWVISDQHICQARYISIFWVDALSGTLGKLTFPWPCVLLEAFVAMRNSQYILEFRFVYLEVFIYKFRCNGFVEKQHCIEIRSHAKVNRDHEISKSMILVGFLVLDAPKNSWWCPQITVHTSRYDWRRLAKESAAKPSRTQKPIKAMGYT